MKRIHTVTGEGGGTLSGEDEVQFFDTSQVDDDLMESGGRRGKMPEDKRQYTETIP